MANRKISDLTALTAPAAGDLLPIVDISEAAAANKNKKITFGVFLASALSSVPLGTAAAPSIAFTGDINTGIYSPGADQLAVSTSGTAKVLFDNTTAPLKEIFSSVYYPVATQVDIGTSPNQVPINGYLGTLAFQDSVSVSVGGILANGLSGIGYALGAGLAVTQITSRTTGVTINAPTGSITLVSAAGSTTYQTFTVTNSTVAATDVIKVSQKSGTDKYAIWVTAVAAGSFALTFATLAGTTTEQPVFNFAVIKAVSS